MASFSFEELWERFETDFPDLEIASGELFHYLKLFQHASSYHALQDTRKLLTKTIDQPKALLALKYAVKHALRRPKAPPLNKWVLLDDKRTVDTPDGRKSYYFDRILSELGVEHVSVINDTFKKTALLAAVDKTVLSSLDNCALDANDRKVLRDAQAVLKRAKKQLANRPLLYAYLASVFTVFFADFHRFNHLFKGKDVRHFLLTTHYHHEGLVAAAKINGITVTEFQHGLIAKEDLYYAYPASVARFTENALFADRICVFGVYWKRVLTTGHEYPNDRIFLMGDYSLRSEGVARYKGVKKENALLVAAQKNSVEEYINYVKGLVPIFERHYPDWQIWVKLHPLERKPEAYDELKSYPMCRVFGRESDLMQLLAQCKIQVSIYSTTLFDALGLEVLNLSIQDYGRYADYARAMVSEKVAKGIGHHQDPIREALSTESHDLLEESDVYMPFNPAIVQQLFGDFNRS